MQRPIAPTSTDVSLILNQQLETFKNTLEKTPGRGSYFIEDMRMEEWKSAKNTLLSRLLTMLAITHHGYVWKQTESLDPAIRGVLITWIPK